MGIKGERKLNTANLSPPKFEESEKANPERHECHVKTEKEEVTREEHKTEDVEARAAVPGAVLRAL